MALRTVPKPSWSGVRSPAPPSSRQTQHACCRLLPVCSDVTRGLTVGATGLNVVVCAANNIRRVLELGVYTALCRHFNSNTLTHPARGRSEAGGSPYDKPCWGKAWDTTDARALMTYLIQSKYAVYAFELGNEQNTHYTPAEQADNFKILAALLAELYTNVATRPKIIGPDVHGFHGDPLTSAAEKPKLAYLGQFGPACKAAGVRANLQPSATQV